MSLMGSISCTSGVVDLRPGAVTSTGAPSRMSDASAPAVRAPPRLTLEEKLWMDRRKEDLKTYSAFGGGVGAMISTAVTTFGPFNRRMQAATILGGLLIGGCSGYLYADTKALERIQDLSAQSRLRKEYQQLILEKKASKKETPQE